MIVRHLAKRAEERKKRKEEEERRETTETNDCEVNSLVT